VPLLERYENIYLETHNVVLHGELDFIANMIGSHKLIFGTYFPYNTPNATMFAVTQGRIREQDRHNIARSNIEKLISKIR
jgi:predicted TIM-barrel fold metal-dependent hydrolase